MKNENLTQVLERHRITEIAVRKWENLQPAERLTLWCKYQETTFTPSKSPNELTDREIEKIVNSLNQTK